MSSLIQAYSWLPLRRSGGVVVPSGWVCGRRSGMAGAALLNDTSVETTRSRDRRPIRRDAAGRNAVVCFIMMLLLLLLSVLHKQEERQRERDGRRRSLRGGKEQEENLHKLCSCQCCCCCCSCSAPCCCRCNFDPHHRMSPYWCAAADQIVPPPVFFHYFRWDRALRFGRPRINTTVWAS